MSQRLTELDKKLQEMALNNWEQFVSVIGKDAVTSAKICLLRQDKKTYGEIAQKLGITHRAAEYHCVKCNTTD